MNFLFALLSFFVDTSGADESRVLTAEGYDIRHFTCDEIECTGTDGRRIGSVTEVQDALPPINPHHANTRYLCETFCYNEAGNIIGSNPNKVPAE